MVNNPPGLAAEERHPAGADREDDQRLGGKRFDEPAGAELAGAGVEHAQHQPERQEVEQRADRAERQHEPADERDVPVRRRCSCSSSTRSVGMASWQVS